MRDIFFYILIFYLLFIEPFWDHKDSVRFRTDLQKGNVNARLRFYQAGFRRNIIMGAYLLLVMLVFSVPFAHLGFVNPKWPKSLLSFSPQSIILWIILIAYLIYFYLCPLVLVHVNTHVRAYVIKVLAPIKVIMPTSSQEYAWWIINSLNATTEEVIYRGFIFFFVLMLFPHLNLYFVAVISVFFDCVRYYPRFVAIKHVALTGIVYALSYVVTHSLYVPIAMHVIQDMAGLLMPVYRKRSINPI